MFVWLTRNLDIRARIAVTTIVFGWMITVIVLLCWQYNQTMRLTREMFLEVRINQKNIQELMKQNAAKFSATIERNTKAVEQIKDSPDWPK